MPDIRVTAFDHLVLRVVDLERSMAFYGDLLGLAIEGVDDYRNGVRPFVSARLDGQLIDLFPDPGYDPALGMSATGMFHFCLRVAGSLEADVLPRVRAFGAEILEEAPVLRLGASGFARAIYVRDPDGHIVELKEEAA